MLHLKTAVVHLVGVILSQPYHVEGLDTKPSLGECSGSVFPLCDVELVHPPQFLDVAV